jgi:hypothetical protein
MSRKNFRLRNLKESQKLRFRDELRLVHTSSESLRAAMADP